MNMRIWLAAVALVCFAPAPLVAQIGVPARPLPDGALVIETAEQGPIRVTIMKGLELPWDLAFLPNEDILVTERPSRRLRMVRNGVLDPRPIAGLPDIDDGSGGGLMSVAIHPQFAENGWVYLTYTKSAAPGRRAVGLARGRLEGMRLTDVRELFAADEEGGGPAPGLPLVFGPEGYLYMGVGGANDEIAQRGDSYYGKVLRFEDDGSVPENPFAGRQGFKPEIYTFGHRNMVGMTIHPTTDAVWQNENGPLGGDEVNILELGANYGWPLVSYGRDYSGAPVSKMRTMVGVEDPVLFWNPAIAISGMTFYTGDRFPAWENNLFVGGLQFGRIPRTGQMHRIVFNENWEEIRREALFVDLRQRIRDVEQGPDGLLYVLTDEQDGALLRLEPVDDSSLESKGTLEATGEQRQGLWVPDYGTGQPFFEVEDVAFKPWAKGLFEARQQHDLEPHARCKPSGGIRQFLTPYGVEIVEIEELNRLYIFDIGGPHTFREVFMDGRAHPADVTPSYYGHNVGWWEGDTLVIDSVGYNEDFWFERMGLPHTEAVHVTEYLRRVDAETVEYTFVMKDDAAYEAPVEGRMTLSWREGEELFEYICQQANYAFDLMINPEAPDAARTSPIVP